MSFGEGNLRERIAELEAANERLMNANGALCAEVNRQSGLIVALKAFSHEAWAELRLIGPSGTFCYERLAELAEGAGLEVPR